MMWLMENMGTIVPGFVVAAVVFLAARSIWKDKKSGKTCSSCGGCGKGSCDCHGSHRHSA